jgi:hypothetical protein
MHLPPRWQPVLKVLLLLAIFSMAGPELVPAIEMATLLELLGAFLFITAFGAAFKMTAIDVARSLGKLLVPAPLAAAWRYGKWHLKTSAAVLVFGRAAYGLLMLMVGGFYLEYLLQ